MGCCGSREKDDRPEDLKQKIERLTNERKSKLNGTESISTQSDFQGVLKMYDGESSKVTSNQTDQQKYVLVTSQKIEKGKPVQITCYLADEDNFDAQSQCSFDYREIPIPQDYKENHALLLQKVKSLQVQEKVDQQLILDALEYTDNNLELSTIIVESSISQAIQQRYYEMKPESKKRQEQIDQVRLLLEDCMKQYEYCIYYISDETILRFLKSRDYDGEDTLFMFEQYIMWRKEHSIHKIQSIQFEETEKIKQIFPHGWHYSDKKGRPVYIEVLDKVQYTELIKKSEDSNQGIVTYERLSQYFMLNFENLITDIFPKASQKEGKLINQMVRIIDLKNYQLTHVQVKEFMNLTQKIIQDNYPEILGKFYFINANKGFSFVWKFIIKKLIPESTAKKITVLGTDYHEKLFEEIDIKNFPKSLGGECECGENCLKQDIGSWSTVDLFSENVL